MQTTKSTVNTGTETTMEIRTNPIKAPGDFRESSYQNGGNPYRKFEEYLSRPEAQGASAHKAPILDPSLDDDLLERVLAFNAKEGLQEAPRSDGAAERVRIMERLQKASMAQQRVRAISA